LVPFAIFASPRVTEWLQYDRAAIAAGKWWRMLSCHWTHWSAGHLLWDAVMFLVLGLCCERLAPRRTPACLAGAVLFIPLVLWWAQPAMHLYRGLSGLDSALFVLLAAVTLRESLAARRTAESAAAVGLILSFAAKTLCEAVTGVSLFVEAGGVFEPAPLAHAAGGLAGLLAGSAPSPGKNFKLRVRFRPLPANIVIEETGHAHRRDGGNRVSRALYY
jgi:rhomboid family GlyGly-CTERM serine protease